MITIIRRTTIIITKNKTKKPDCPLVLVSGLRALPSLICSLRVLPTWLFRFTYHFHFVHPTKEDKYSCSPALATWLWLLWLAERCLQVSWMTLSPTTALSCDGQTTSAPCLLNCAPGGLQWGRSRTPPHESQSCMKRGGVNKVGDPSIRLYQNYPSFLSFEKHYQGVFYSHNS